jgi:hypothetical protein
MEQWNFKPIDVVNGHVRREDEKQSAIHQGEDLMAQGHLDIESLVTCSPFSEITTAF